MSKKILIVEDQFIEANNLRLILLKAGYLVMPVAKSVPEALAQISQEIPDLVLLDILLKTEQTGIDLAHILKERSIAFIFLSANNDPATFNLAKATGPYGFLVKPFRMDDVLAMIDIAEYLHQQQLALIKITGPRSAEIHQAKTGIPMGGIIGKTKQMTEIAKYITIAASTDFPVLILGESGTGKELVAKAIHDSSKQRDQPLVIVDCGALPDHLIEAELFGHEKGSFTGAHEKRIGKFEQANNGTIFLDEIGELPLEMQVKFLRALQEKEICPVGGKRKKINVRVIAATNRNLEAEITSGGFRMDLYYRLNVFPIVIPPLRQRKEDIVLLADHFLKIFAKRENKLIKGFASNVKQAFLDHSWPGNVRELENLVARAVLLSEGSLIDQIFMSKPEPNKLPPDGKLKTIADNERDHILAALSHCSWKIYGQGGAAELLDINGSTLKSRMKKLGIEKNFTTTADRSGI